MGFECGRGSCRVWVLGGKHRGGQPVAPASCCAGGVHTGHWDSRPQTPRAGHAGGSTGRAQRRSHAETLDRPGGGVLSSRRSTGCGNHFWFCEHRLRVLFRSDGRLQEKKRPYVSGHITSRGLAFQRLLCPLRVRPLGLERVHTAHHLS